MASRSLTIDIRTADAQTIAALKKIQKELRDTGTTAERTSRSGLSLGDALGGLAIGAGLGMAISEFEEAETTARKTAAAIASTGNAAGVSAEQQAKMVDELSKLAAVDDEVVAGGANILRTFTQVRGDAFEPALAAALDLSAALGTDLQSATLRVGKALNDPVKGVTALTRAGVSFTAQQKEQIKAMVAAGDTAGAQKLILQELETQFGGQAEAAATDSAKMRVAFGNAAESLGGALAPALSGAAEVAERASSAFQSLPQPLQQAALAGGALAIVGPKIANGLSSAAEFAGVARGKFSGLVSTFAASPVAVGAAGGALAGAALIIADVAHQSELAAKAVDQLRAEAEASGKSIDEVFREKLAKTLAGVEGGFDLGESGNLFRKTLDDAGISAVQLEEALTGTDAQLQAVKDRIVETAGAAGSSVLGPLLDDLQILSNASSSAEEKQRALDSINKQLGVTTDATTGALEDQAVALGKVAGGLDEYASKTEAVTDASEAVNDAVADVAAAQDKVADAERGVADAQEAVADANQAVADARRGVEDAERGVADALKGVETAQRGVTDAEEAAVDAREAVTEATEAWVQAAADAERGSEFLADAEERVARSQEDSRLAQEALTQARRDYGATMQELATDVAAATDDVTLGQIAIDEAKKRLAELMADPEATANERKRAEIAVREAERRLAELEQRLKETQETFDRNNAGVEASDAVREAHERADEAAQNQQDAEESLADAQEEANRRVAAAQDSLTEAIDRRRDADQRVLDAKQAVVDANDRVRDAVRGVEDANRRVADAVGNVADAQQRVTEAKESVKTARGEVEQAERDVEKAVRDQYDAYQDLSELFAPGSAARTRMEWLTEQMRLQYSYLPQPGTVPFIDLFGGGKSGPGGKGGGVPDGKPARGATTPAAPAVPAGPETRPGGWVRQPNGRWWRPRKPGEANYGDGYVDQAEMLRMIQAEEAAKAPKPDTALKPAAAEITVNVIGADDPATTAERVSKRLGWEITRLIGSAA